MANHINRLRTERGWSMAYLADLVGTDPSTINKLEKGKTKLTDNWLVRLARAFGIDPSGIISFTPAADEPVLPLYELPSNATSRKVIPIMGTAAGSLLQGAIQFSESTVVNYIDAPPMLENAVGIYGVYIDGDSMEPMFRHGSPILLTPFKPPKVGDAVVVQEKHGDTIKGTVGILSGRNSDVVKLRKLNPNGIIEVPTKYLHAMHKVLDLSEILGG